MFGEVFVSIVDVVYWVKGCSLFGQWCYVVLLVVDQDCGLWYWLIDIKEVGKVVVFSVCVGDMFWINGECVVMGVCCFFFDLGDCMVWGCMFGSSFFMCEF